MVFSAASADAVAMDAEVKFIVDCNEDADKESTDAMDGITPIRALFSATNALLNALLTIANDECAPVNNMENDVNETTRFAFSDVMVPVRMVSVAAKDVDAFASPVATAEIDDARRLCSLFKVVVSVPCVATRAVFALANEVVTDAMDALRLFTSMTNAAEIALPTTTSDAAALLNAVETDVIALARLMTSADSALDADVTSAITVAICVKLGFVVSSLAIAANVSRLEGAAPFKLLIAELNALLAAAIS